MIGPRKKTDVDVVKDVLLLVQEALPDSVFVKSLLFQYEERGSLSRRQLEGLLGKAQKLKQVPPARLATLQAIIQKMAVRDKTPPSQPAPLYEMDAVTGELINSILARYPQHKRILFFQAKYSNHETLAPSELTELKRLHKLLIRE
jgi:hypothetical protein